MQRLLLKHGSSTCSYGKRWKAGNIYVLQSSPTVKHIEYHAILSNNYIKKDGQLLWPSCADPI